MGSTEKSCLNISEKGYVSPLYPKALIERKKYPPGLRINDALLTALPHANVMYTIKPMIFMILPKNPVRFNCMGSPNESLHVNILMIVAVKNLDRSTKILREIGDLLAEGLCPSFLERGQRTQLSEEKFLGVLGEPSHITIHPS